MKTAQVITRATHTAQRVEDVATGKRPVAVNPKYDQPFFAQEARELAEKVGYSGPEDAEIGGTEKTKGITVAEARAYLTQKLHEIHVGCYFPHCAIPSALSVAQHLGLDDDAECVGILEEAFAKVEAREREEAKAK